MLSDDKRCREAFEKAGYWPNEVMWKAWCQAWDAALATPSAGVEQYRAQVEEARSLILHACDLMTTEQVGQWAGVRAWLERDTETYAPSTEREHILRLLNHIEDVLDDDNWERIDPALWNAVSLPNAIQDTRERSGSLPTPEHVTGTSTDAAPQAPGVGDAPASHRSPKGLEVSPAGAASSHEAQPEQCAYCHQWYPKPVSYHHTNEECRSNESEFDNMNRVARDAIDRHHRRCKQDAEYAASEAPVEFFLAWAFLKYAAPSSTVPNVEHDALVYFMALLFGDGYFEDDPIKERVRAWLIEQHKSMPDDLTIGAMTEAVLSARKDTNG